MSVSGPQKHRGENPASVKEILLAHGNTGVGMSGCDLAGSQVEMDKQKKILNSSLLLIFENLHDIVYWGLGRNQLNELPEKRESFMTLTRS